jgi:hypothetical protein
MWIKNESMLCDTIIQKSRACCNCYFCCFLFIILILLVFRLLYRENNFSFLYFDDCYFSTILTSTSLSSSTEEIVNKANLLITHSFAMIMMMLCTFVFSPTLLSFWISYLFLYPFTYALQ